MSYMDQIHGNATADSKAAFKAAEFVVILTPTNYDSDKSYFGTRSVETYIYIWLPII